MPLGRKVLLSWEEPVPVQSEIMELETSAAEREKTRARKAWLSFLFSFIYGTLGGSVFCIAALILMKRRDLAPPLSLEQTVVLIVLVSLALSVILWFMSEGEHPPLPRAVEIRAKCIFVETRTSNALPWPLVLIGVVRLSVSGAPRWLSVSYKNIIRWETISMPVDGKKWPVLRIVPKKGKPMHLGIGPGIGAERVKKILNRKI